MVNSHCYYINSEFHHKGSRRNQSDSGGGMFGEKLSHYVDLARWWTGGELDWVQSVCAPNIVPYYEVRDNYHTTWRFTSGAVGHLTFMMGPAANVDGDPLQLLDLERDTGHHLRLLVVGTRGCAEADAFARTLRRWAFSDTEACQRSDKVEEHTWSVDEDHRYFHNTTDQTRDIVRRVRDGLPPALAPRDAFETMRLSFAAEASATAGERIFLR
ncbi:MAG: Gfo/Idh/MocA family protein [Planctomycetota bacterium]